MHNTRLALELPPPPLNLISQECGLTAALELRSNETPPTRHESEATGDTPLFGERASGGGCWQGSAEVRGAAGSAGPWCVAVLRRDARRSGCAPDSLVHG